MTVRFTDALPYVLLWTAWGAAVFPGGRRGGATLIALSLAAAVAAGIVAWAGRQRHAHSLRGATGPLRGCQPTI